MTRTDSVEPPEANPPVRAPHHRAGLDEPGRFVVQSVAMGWRWLTRMRTALYLLGVLALFTLLATIVPQSPNVPGTVNAWRAGTDGPGTFVSGLIDLVGGYDVYGSAGFLAVLFLLFVSLTACLIPRYRAWWRLARRSRPPRVRDLTRQERVARFRTPHAPEEVLARARGLLDEHRWRLRSDHVDSASSAPTRSPQVAAEKGHVLREGGSLVFHTSFYVLLIAVVMGQLLGFSGQVGIVEGQSFAETAVGYWQYQPGRWWSDADHRGFVLDLDEFEVDWRRDPRFGGTPTVFESHLTVTRPDGTAYTETVGSNDPAVVDGMKILQLGWGYAPRMVVEVDGEVVYDGFLTLSQDGAQGEWPGAVKAPAADPDVGLEVFFWPYAPDGDIGDGVPFVFTGAPWADAPLILFREYRGDVQLDRSQNVNVLDTARMEQTGAGALRVGDSYTTNDGVTVSFPELRRWSGLQISNKPTVPYLLLGAALVLIGLLPALYAYRRRLWVEAVQDLDGTTVVTVAGRAFQRAQAFEDEHHELVDELTERLAGTPTEPSETDDSTPSEAVPR